MRSLLRVGLLVLGVGGLGCSNESPPPSSGGPSGLGQSAGSAGAPAGQGGAGGTSAGASGKSAGGTSAAGGGANAGGKSAGGASAAGGANSGGSAGGVGGGCQPAAQPGEFYALEASSLAQADPVSMCEFRGKVVLVVNVASKCGYTPQYGPLQALYAKYREQGFEILGFPCNQFGNQESGTEAEISAFCTEKYSITFPMFSKIEVNGANQHPVYAWLKSQPGGEGDIPWNFTKFLLDRKGKLIKRIPTATSPDEPGVVKLIEDALAAAP